MMDLPDVNVWLALSAEDHPCRDSARRYWNELASDRLAFTTVTMLGLVRLVMNPVVMAGKPLKPSESWEIFESLWALPEVTYIAEPQACLEILARRFADGTVTPRTWTDAYLASVAIAASARLVTFDRDFSSFGDLNWLLLEP